MASRFNLPKSLTSFDLSNIDQLAGLKQLTGQDAFYVYSETAKAPLHIGSVAIYDPSTTPDGKVRFKDILNFIDAKLDTVPQYRRKLQMVPMNADHPYWVNDPDFDIEFHVRHIALPHPGDWRQLCIQAARIHSRPLDMSKPLWEYWVVEGLDNVPNIPKGSYAIISKIHHSMIDGVSGIELAHAMHSLTPEVQDIEPAYKKGKTGRKPNLVEQLARAQMNSVVKPFHAANVLRNMVPGAFKYLSGVRAGEFELFRQRTPRTRFNSKVSGHRVFGGHTFSMEAIKEIRKKVPGSTVNDVILSVVGGTLRKYLLAKDELPNESLVTMTPISVRSEKEKSAMGNEVSAMSMALGTQIGDALTRLHFVHEKTSESKAMSKALGARQLSDASKLAPAMVQGVAQKMNTRLGLANRVTPMFNTIVSNVPGPQVPLYMNGAKLVTMYGLGPVMDGSTLFHAVMSYCGQIELSFSSDRKVLPDPDFYAECMWEAWDELYKAAHRKAAPSKRKKSHTKEGEATTSVDVDEDTNGELPLVITKPKKGKKVVKKTTKANGTTSVAKAKAEKKVKSKKTKAPKTTSTDEILDLSLIKGVGPAMVAKLNDAGIASVNDLATLDDDAVADLEYKLNFSEGRITKAGWVDSAKQLITTSAAAKVNGAALH